jgi:hypothetical protein
VALFGRRRDRGKDEPRDEPQYVEDEYTDYDEDAAQDAHFEPSQGDLEGMSGPFDEQAPDDGVPRLNLGSLLLPLPDEAQVQAKMSDQQPGVIEEVIVGTPIGDIRVKAYAAPRSGGLWEEACGELATQLKSEGATVRSVSGEWGQELMATLGEMSIRVIGVEGERWMLRGHVVGPQALAAQAAHVLRTMVRGAVVVRGSQPWPPNEPLPIQLPPEAIQYLQAQGG